jgi:hypothetical protein
MAEIIRSAVAVLLAFLVGMACRLTCIRLQSSGPEGFYRQKPLAALADEVSAGRSFRVSAGRNVFGVAFSFAAGRARTRKVGRS